MIIFEIKKMKVKTCFKCKTEKAINLFYKHPKMKDGYLGKCKECAKQDVKINIAGNYKNPDYVKKERKRNRDKYYRLSYGLLKRTPQKRRQAQEIYKKKYPEKYQAKIKAGRLIKKGFHGHHWSYNEKHFKDIIYLLPIEHCKFHRFIVYSQPDKMYRTLNGTLLNTKKKHINYFNKIKNLE
jgi:hypothetical protein